MSDSDPLATEEELEGQVPKSLGWIVTYQDMMALLVVFFALFFAVAQAKPEEIIPERAEVVGRRRSMNQTVVTRHSNVPAWWKPLGHVRFRENSTNIPVDEFTYLDQVLRPHIQASCANIVLVDYAPQRAAGNLAIERTKKLTTYLESRGIDSDRIFHFYTNEEDTIAAIISRPGTTTSTPRVQICVAPIALPVPSTLLTD